MQNQASLNYAEVQPKLNNKVVTAHKKWEKNFASRSLLRNFARDKNTPHMMTDKQQQAAAMLAPSIPTAP